MQFHGILPKGFYTPCLPMADRALLAGYPQIKIEDISWQCHAKITSVAWGHYNTIINPQNTKKNTPKLTWEVIVWVFNKSSMSNSAELWICGFRHSTHAFNLLSPGQISRNFTNHVLSHQYVSLMENHNTWQASSYNIMSSVKYMVHHQRPNNFDRDMSEFVVNIKTSAFTVMTRFGFCVTDRPAPEC